MSEIRVPPSMSTTPVRADEKGSMLVTGATGVVGTELVAAARAAGWRVTGCSGRGGPDAVAWRMGQALPPEELRGPWDVVVHAAARPRWNLPLDEARAANLDPVAALEPVVGPNTHVVHVSTAFAVGLRGSIASEDPADYRNSYEWSKAAAERDATVRYGASIVRPPLVIGRRSDGAVSRFSGLYLVMQASMTGVLPAFVGEPDAPVEIVSTCDVARCVLDVAERPAAAPVVLGAGDDALPMKSVADAMYLAVNRWRAARRIEPLDTPAVITPDQWYRFFLPFSRPHLTERQLRSIDLLGNFIPYMSVAEPIGVTWPVADVAAGIDTAITAWATRLPGLASGFPRPWKGIDDK